MTVKTAGDELLPLWRVLIQAPEIEERAYEAMECGSGGVEILDNERAYAFFNGAESQCAEFCRLLSAQGFSTQPAELVPQKNWVQECSEMWQAIEAPPFSIVPVTGPESPVQRERLRINIIPGEGFGTGHHASTRLALQILGKLDELGFRPKHALDLGTGSGILAMGIVKLWNCPTDAIDNDPAAIRNATDNLTLNDVPGLTLAVGDISSSAPTYDLIVANIYAEVLVGLKDEFRARLAPGGILLLSGIMEDKTPLIHEAFGTNDLFGKSGWKTLHSRSEVIPTLPDPGWFAIAMRKEG